MTRQGRWRRLLARCVVAAGLAAGPGCMCMIHPIDRASPEVLEPCRAAPKGAREHVYVFFVHGMDPLDCANLTGVRDYVQSLGFTKTYYGQLFHTWHFEGEIKKVKEKDPDARIVLIGFSFGANMVCHLANAAKKDGIPIDLMVYLGGNTMKNEPHDQPENVHRMINILAQGCIWNGDTLERAENIQVTGVWHFGSPTHPYTLEVLARELAAVAASVPVPAPPPEPVLPAWPETAPPPRRSTSEKPGTPRGDWDFLRPVARFQSQPKPTEAAPPVSVPASQPQPAARQEAPPSKGLFGRGLFGSRQ
ncbi:MAG TPA: hypothetical protein VFA26_14045 [Gemmataceae bacterium]|nr:hypothetical protein [Gemmataceae bacterium]